MAESETLVFRASLTPKIYRAFEIAGTASLYTLARAIARSFDFDFDHAFGFYSKLKGNIYDSPVRYELFVEERQADACHQGLSVGRDQDAIPLRLRRRMGISGRARETKAEGAEGQASQVADLGREGARPIPRPLRTSNAPLAVKSYSSETVRVVSQFPRASGSGGFELSTTLLDSPSVIRSGGPAALDSVASRPRCPPPASPTAGSRTPG